MRTGSQPSIWVDVEDFFDYFAFNPRPSGIQRLAFEIKRELHASLGASGRLRFVRRGPGGTGALLQEAPWAEVAALIDEAQHTKPKRTAPPPRLAARQGAKQALNRLPAHLREPLFRAAILQSQAGRNWQELREALGNPARPPRRTPLAAATKTDGFKNLVRPGDHFLVLGAPWAVPGFPALLAELKQRYGLRVALLFYDLIPARRPEWCTPGAVALFDDWLEATLPLCDTLMAISRYTAHDVEAFAQERAIPIAGPVRPVPVGAGFGPAEAPAGPRPLGLPQPGHYVLFVSTLEARKNHALAVRVWRKLADEVRAGVRAAESVPELVFAGRVGWMVADLMQQLDNSAWLGGRVRLVRDPTDIELRALYEGCLFTLFPSLFEGWGLPVTESLAQGKPCLAASTTALPEAGGALCRYFDPEDAGSAHRAVAALLDDRPGLTAWQDQVRREFRPTPWAETARAVLAELHDGAEALGAGALGAEAAPS